jgi:hypothetical protein
MSGPEGFEYRSRKAGEVAIFHHGKLSKMLKDKEADAFLKKAKDLKGAEAQEHMSQAVGNDGQGVGLNATAPGGQDPSLQGDTAGHPHKEFRRKTG